MPYKVGPNWVYICFLKYDFSPIILILVNYNIHHIDKEEMSSLLCPFVLFTFYHLSVTKFCSLFFWNISWISPFLSIVLLRPWSSVALFLDHCLSLPTGLLTSVSPSSHPFSVSLTGRWSFNDIHLFKYFQRFPIANRETSQILVITDKALHDLTLSTSPDVPAALWIQHGWLCPIKGLCMLSPCAGNGLSPMFFHDPPLPAT